MNDARRFVVGDVHGCPDELERLLDHLAPGAGDTICFLGDYVDRGPNPRGVIDRLIRLRHEGPQCLYLKGNHEDMFLAFMGQPGRHGDAFLWNGGDSTLASYGCQGLSGPAVAERLPADHREFLAGLRTHAYIDTFLCVHAGVRPTRPLAAQSEEDLLWIREDFISQSHPFPYTVLFGHTPHREVFVDLPFKVGLDTGLVYGNRLSCLEIDARQVWQIRRGQRAITAGPID
ncbi:MAG TPA: metallophosphoesterase family protein [Candidatus Dormibacteraeota bacterium]|nr:metallophosphoesterase family protein [Candidatus Dormibacteraeota bacterium]